MKHSRNSKGKQYEESRREKQEDLRGELRKLRKEVLQLRKENAKLRGRDLELQEILEDVVIEEVIVQHPTCPKCGSKHVKILEKLQNDRDYYFCENPHCGARGPVK